MKSNTKLYITLRSLSHIFFLLSVCSCRLNNAFVPNPNFKKANNNHSLPTKAGVTVEGIPPKLGLPHGKTESYQIYE
jgi:hypothetical protein